MKPRVMLFFGDERGVSAVLGSIIMLMIAVISYGMIQATQLPIWNAEFEWAHLDDVYEDLVAFKSDVEDVALLKVPKTSKIRVGARYPNRVILINPGAGVSGALVSESANISVQYTLDVPGNPSFTRSYESNRIVFRAFGTIDAPRLVYEHGLLVRDFGNAALSTSDQTLVVNEEIFLPLLTEGPLSLSSLGTEAVVLQPLTELFTTSKVQSVTVTLATAYPEVWEEALTGVATANTTITVNSTANTVVIASTVIKQIVFPAGNVTAEALYAGMINLSTKFVPGAFSTIDLTKAYPHISDITIKAVGTKEEQLTHSTITATVRNATAPFDIFADFTSLTGDAASYPLFPDASSPDSINATSWTIPNSNNVSWSNIVHPAFRPGDSVMVSFWVNNTELYMRYFTVAVFTRRTETSWAPIHIYILRGKDSRDFWRYDVTTNTKTTLQPTPAKVKEGGALTFDGTYVYALRGGDTTGFWRYDIASNNWTVMAVTPANVKDGGALIFDGNYIYALRGNNDNDFWRYDIAGNTWTAKAVTPANVKEGGALIFDGNYIYALRGNNSNAFWRYSIAANAWTAMQTTPADVKEGGALTFDNVDGNYIYAFRGSDTTEFWRYNVTSLVWTAMAVTPDLVKDGGALTFDGSYIYALRGKDTQEFWRYDITADSWTRMTDMLDDVNWGGALVFVVVD